MKILITAGLSVLIEDGIGNRMRIASFISGPRAIEYAKRVAEALKISEIRFRDEVISPK